MGAFSPPRVLCCSQWNGRQLTSLTGTARGVARNRAGGGASGSPSCKLHAVTTGAPKAGSRPRPHNNTRKSCRMNGTHEKLKIGFLHTYKRRQL
ncbi:hypothetical protein ANANG_G00179760 [Anguilla anguilla]|uniref:Uncharacterized protein n=1 Tax=Anguilla anguilla TaxID=7936 RepID=A0A9D3RTR0_ANGAN|nr:hypothetical protein ANANG_G00179760 [Anguilla anguilla]